MVHLARYNRAATGGTGFVSAFQSQALVKLFSVHPLCLCVSVVRSGDTEDAQRIISRLPPAH